MESEVQWLRRLFVLSVCIGPVPGPKCQSGHDTKLCFHSGLCNLARPRHLETSLSMCFYFCSRRRPESMFHFNNKQGRVERCLERAFDPHLAESEEMRRE